MKETGILSHAEMIQALLDKRKSMTRRAWGLEKVNQEPDAWYLVAVFQDGLARFTRKDDTEDITLRCPYGGVGDRIYCKETFAEWQGTLEGIRNSDLSAIEAREYIVYKAGAKDWQGLLKDRRNGHPWKIQPSIYMPKWASRITLEITAIRAERIQAITEEDAIAEGIDRHEDSGHNIFWFEVASEYHGNTQDVTATKSYARLWDSLNAKRGLSWDKNPWCWVISFKEIP